jgi:hypothetical protein
MALSNEMRGVLVCVAVLLAVVLATAFYLNGSENSINNSNDEGNNETGITDQKYSVSINKEGKGTVTGAGSYFHGEEATLNAVPDYGYHFVGWYINGSEHPISTSTDYSFEVVDQMSIEGRFELIRDASFTIYRSSDVAPCTLTFVAKYDIDVIEHTWYVFEVTETGEVGPAYKTEEGRCSITVTIAMTLHIVHQADYAGGLDPKSEETIVIG